ncbi:FISUMP domain-containing protein [uncultured Lutibacter sp.]|uniref:FISUMP domain-containing protein n=1 Tax=uncultured Lutibacter sp. TaxID=437739 RepID=UPI00261E3A96|nr:FISUMP domain-containing protein [uncultured Lutibacter sp.]
MKNIIYTFKTYMLLVIFMATSIGYSQIAVNTTPNTATCSLSGNTVTASVPTEALTGDNIALNITLPGSYDAGCVKTVTITKSSNLVFQSSGAIPFADMGGGTYQNTAPPVLAGNDGQNFNVFFKFPNYTTCNGAVGTFDVTVSLDCAGVITTCTTSVNVIARADNYWSITKEFVTGDLTCGVSKWKIKLTHNNPNGAGLGTYKIAGTINESASVTVPIVSGASFPINQNGYSNGTWNKYVYLQNCSPDGSVLTNIADYNFTLGDGCDTMIGSVTATSPPLASPNASISFTKWVSNSYNTNLTPGCDARYYITVCNNGNVPWTDLVITDNLNIPGITITNISLPGGWTSSPIVPPYPPTTYTFSAAPGFVLNPSDCQTIYIDFQIDGGATIGSTISNTAYLSYVASGSGGSPGGPPVDPCPGISCPTLDTTVQNTDSTVDFVVEEPKAIPSIKKCILDPPNPLIPPIYQIGNNIKYSIMVGNSGSGDLTTTITDALGSPQNLEINPGSISYDYYSDQNAAYKNSCSPPFGTSIPPPFSVVANTVDLQNPTWAITNMPGICDWNRSNFLIITFETEILPQLSGSKTNTAMVPHGAGTLSSLVNYSIDQVGILAIHKEADAEIVESGQSFNYTITVSNNGSVPLDNIVITDMLPDCVSINGQIRIEDDLANPITNSSSGNVIITVDPSTQLLPGDNFIITIPVVKSGGGNCCNESVSVTAEMTTTDVELDANFGSEEAPAACVSGTECCDIEDFDASIQEHNGSFNVTINGGSIPIQEVEISMIDYHVEYSNEDCKPDDMGNFGTLSTSNTTLVNLILNASDNNTSSLTWLPGSPGILNSNVNLNIVDPLTLNLDCCDVTFSFCLKVRVKDVNCNVCEKIICYSSNTEPEPCEIVIKDIGQDKKYCPGDSITLNWSGSPSPGFVNVSLFDNTNNVVYQVLATGIPNTGVFTYTIPAGIPCDPPRTWSLIVEDSESLCIGRSNTFTIECCHQTDCGCGEWLTNYVTVKGYIKQIPQDPTLDIKIKANLATNVNCGTKITLKPFMYYSFTAPNYVCNPENCNLSYKWEVIDTHNNIIQAGVGKTFNYNFSSYGNYKIVFTPICGGKQCEPCTIYAKIDKLILQNPNNLPHDIPIGLPTNGDVYNPCTGKTWMNKNLGATRVATSRNDALAYGDLYQWGRLTDGHEKRTSSTTSTMSNSDVPGNGDFIVNTLMSNLAGDWRKPKNDNLWQGVTGTNNPCPSGYRIPTQSELEAERLCWKSNGADGAFNSPLKWTIAGFRHWNQISGNIYGTGAIGKYWTSQTNGYKSQFLTIFVGNAFITNGLERASGASVRCIKN